MGIIERKVEVEFSRVILTMKNRRFTKSKFRYKLRVGDESIEPLVYALAHDCRLERQTEKNFNNKTVA
jgi:hypothetical protein